MRFLATATQIILQLCTQRRGPLTPTLSPRSGEREESRRVVRLVAVEDALERIEVPLRRRRPLVEAVAADVALGFFDHRLGQLFEPLSGPHGVDLNLRRALDVV